MIPLEIQILCALALDQLIGDPQGWPHPVRWIGALAVGVEKRLRYQMTNQFWAGVFGLLLVFTVTGVLAWAVLWGLGQLHQLALDLGGILVLWTTFAAKDLRVHSMRVYHALERGDVQEGRHAVSMLVGRDTEQLDAPEISRACVESVAENSVDGVIAPVFFAFLFGPLGAVMYKAVNTLDSMWGYTTGGYKDFGMAAARFDDVVSWIPARLGALVLLLGGGLLGYPAKRGWRIFLRDRNTHLSPNGGQAEAAMAGLLGVQLGGEGRYHGQVSSRPRLGDPVYPLRARHILQANRLAGMAVVLTVVVMLVVRAGMLWWV
ncbi:MAG: adenosylcobinamide-phosphate synthase CbiB [Desulfovermiculus sp.]